MRRRELTAELASRAVIGASQRGVRPREWSQRLLGAALRAQPAGSIVAFDANLLAYGASLDRVDIGAAETHLRMLALVPVGRHNFLPHIALEVAYFNARWLHDPERASATLLAAKNAATPDQPLSAWRMLRAEAAIAFAEGRTADAHALAAAGLAALEQVQTEAFVSVEPEATNLRELMESQHIDAQPAFARLDSAPE
jgi:hypothetical protein